MPELAQRQSVLGSSAKQEVTGAPAVLASGKCFLWCEEAGAELGKGGEGRAWAVGETSRDLHQQILCSSSGRVAQYEASQVCASQMAGALELHCRGQSFLLHRKLVLGCPLQM